jgi:hypothetical protein
MNGAAGRTDHSAVAGVGTDATPLVVVNVYVGLWRSHVSICWACSLGGKTG